VPRGVDVPSLDQDRLWDYTPLKTLKAGQLLVGGDMLGSTFENDLFAEHRIMVSPKITGRIVEVMPAG
jgi:V-type H+-transporting ATPase subunit A